MIPYPKKRILTALALLLVTALATFFCPPFLWALLTGLIAQILLWEFASMLKMSSLTTKRYLFVSGFVQWLLWLLNFRLGVMGSSVVLLFWLLAVPLWLKKRWVLKPDIVGQLMGWWLIFPGWIAFQILRPSHINGGKLLFVMGLVWIADITAYFAGKIYGTRQLVAQISPGKTWEGLLGAALGTFIFVLIPTVLGYPFLSLHWALGFLVALFLCAISVLGDLLESWLKRCADLKDSSYLLPGHGGFYDRLDGLIAVTAASVAFLTIIESFS